MFNKSRFTSAHDADTIEFNTENTSKVQYLVSVDSAVRRAGFNEF